MISVSVKLILRPAQERQLDRWLYRLTGLWNWAVRKLEQDGKAGIRYSGYEFKALLNGHAAKIGLPSYAVYGMAGQAYEAVRRHRSGIAKRPRLKSRRNRLKSIPFDHGFQPKSDSQVFIPKLGLTRFHRQAIPAGRVGQARIVKRVSGWYLCLFIQAEPQPVPVIANGAIGIDTGFSALLTTSAGEIVEHPRELEATHARLGQAQRGNRAALTARLHERIANQRRNRNHHLSRRLVSENRLIAWSKDNTRGIASRFGRSVASSSHSQLRLLLTYKCRTGGREFVEVASRNSTRTCAACRALTGPTGFAGLSVRRWTCACGASHDRDVNAAVNTLVAGLGMSHERAREGASGIAI